MASLSIAPASRRAAEGAAVAAALLLGACGDRAPAPREDGVAQEAARAGYIAPPRVEQVEAGPRALVLTGAGPPGARIRITETGGTHGATADGQGRWRVEAPARAGPRLFTLAAENGERPLEAEGRLLVLPGAPPLLLRPGHGAMPLATGAGAPRIVSVDVASDGAAAVSGLAQPAAPVVTRVDGVPPAQDEAVGSGGADSQGRFSVILAQPLGPGEHAIEVNTPGGAARTRIAVAPAASGPATFVADRTAEGWRVTWRAPGGGVQTTYVLPGGGS
jgi:hypothetical protein